MRKWIDLTESLIERDEGEDDPRYTNDGVFVDPDHKNYPSGHWGASHHGSSQITGHSATMIGASGYRPSEPSRVLQTLARKKLQAIFDSPGSKEPLYHGFENQKKREWTVGETLTLPLTATSGSIYTVSYGLRLEREHQEGPATLFEFPKGTRIVGYQKWRRGDAKEFGYVWSEAITAGKFRVVSVREQEYDGAWWKPTIVIVRLEPVAYFDPTSGEWADA